MILSYEKFYPAYRVNPNFNLSAFVIICVHLCLSVDNFSLISFD